MEYKDYYRVLGVERDATPDQIKKAYRKLARKYHPDVSASTDAERRFKEIGEAYAVLKDADKRQAYDRLGSDWQSGEDFRPPPDWHAPGFGGSGGGYTTVDPSQFSDFFETLFGGHPAGGFRQAQPFASHGEDIDAAITIDLEDAYHGSTRQLELQFPELTADGRVTRRGKTLNVRIPKGVKPGQRIRLAGQGGPGIGGGEAGDLYLEVRYRPHRLYRPEGADVYVDLPVAPWEAALGAVVKVPTPTGAVELKIPAGSQQGRRLRLKGRGIPASTKGDFYAVVRVVLPPVTTDAEREAYERMKQTNVGFDPRADLGV